MLPSIHSRFRPVFIILLARKVSQNARNCTKAVRVQVTSLGTTPLTNGHRLARDVLLHAIWWWPLRFWSHPRPPTIPLLSRQSQVRRVTPGATSTMLREALNRMSGNFVCMCRPRILVERLETSRYLYESLTAPRRASSQASSARTTAAPVTIVINRNCST